MCWGKAAFGEGGGAASRPRAIPELEDARQVALGWGFGCAIDAGGVARCFESPLLARRLRVRTAHEPSASAPTTRGLVPTEGDRFFVGGYHPYWTGTAWEDYPFDALDRLYFFELEAGPDGDIADPHGWPDEWLDVDEYLRACRVAIR